MQPFADEVGVDNVGSSMARVPGTAGGPTLAVVGHIDEIGVHVTHIDDDGYLRFGQVGGWDPVDPGRPAGPAARRATARSTGVIGRKPIHLLKDDDRKKVPELKDLHIDIGAKDGDEARELVRIGDVGGDRRRAGGAAATSGWSRARSTTGSAATSPPRRPGSWPRPGGAPGDVLALAVAQEETTFAGARTSAFALEPDVAIVVDVTFATDQPGVELGPITKHALGSGPVIARGTSLHPRVFELLYDDRRGRKGSRSRSSRSAGRPAPTPTRSTSPAAASRPGSSRSRCRYMHSPVEMVSLEDIEAPRS